MQPFSLDFGELVPFQDRSQAADARHAALLTIMSSFTYELPAALPECAARNGTKRARIFSCLYRIDCLVVPSTPIRFPLLSLHSMGATTSEALSSMEELMKTLIKVLMLASLLWASTLLHAGSLTIGTYDNANCYPFTCNDSGTSSGTTMTYEQVYAAGDFPGKVHIDSVTFEPRFIFWGQQPSSRWFVHILLGICCPRLGQ